MSRVFLKSYFHPRSFDQLFDYKSEFTTSQSFVIDNRTSFYKNNNFIKARQHYPNEPLFEPSFNNNDFLFGIDKILDNNNKQMYFFVPKGNMLYHDYRVNSKDKKRQIPNFISLYNYNLENKDFNVKQRKRKNDVIKHNKNFYELNIGDVIKLGRVSLILTKIHLEQNNNLAYCDTFIENNLNKKETKDIKYSKVEKDIYNDNNLVKTKFKNKNNLKNNCNNTRGMIDGNQEESKSNSEKKDICRICFTGENENDSPLLSLCKCSGDSKFIHLSCLSQWFKIKSEIIHSPNGISKTIIFNTLNCEICRVKFPEMVYDVSNGKFYQIYNPAYFINDYYRNYVIFESFELINNKKFIYIISFDTKNRITIGRSHSSDMKLFDVTISRLHSILLRTKDNKILIKDACSKFGTLILLRAKNMLINEKILSIQIGKILLNFHIENDKLNYIFTHVYNLLFCCFTCKKKKNEKSKEKISFINTKSKEQSLDNSNVNVLMINNYLNQDDGKNLDYNIINKKDINIKDIIDIRYIEENNVIKTNE